MWSVEVDHNKIETCVGVILDKEKEGVPWPNGKIGEIKNGYAFYELTIEEIKNGGKKEKQVAEAYITADIVAEPILTAVTEPQFKNWQKKALIAKPAKFTWLET